MNSKLVIARYKEDIAWANKFESKIVYNKFEGENLLPNVGREAHTYLHHIITNYSDLDDISIFAQGNIIDHLDDDQYRKFEEAYYKGFKGPFMAFGHDGQDTVDNFEDYFKYVFFSKSGSVYPTDDVVTLCEHWHVKKAKLTYDDAIKNLRVLPKQINCKWAAIFAVKKEAIRNRSIDFYQRLMKTVDLDNAPLGAHFLERTWSCLFVKDEFPFYLN